MSFKLANPEKIYAENPNLKKEEVNALLKWTETQSHLPKLTELQVILFHHSSHFKTNQTKTNIEKYFILKTKSNILHSAGEDVIRRTLSTIFSGVLPKKTLDGDMVLIIKLLDPNPQNYNCVEHIKLANMGMSLFLHQHGPPNGMVVIVDFKDASFRHLFKINMSAVGQAFHILQETTLLQTRGIHFVNMASITEKVAVLIKPFFKKIFPGEIQVHSNFESMYGHLPEYCLPKDYGGKLKSVMELKEDLVQNMIENLDFFKWHDNQKIDENRQ